MRPKKIFYGSVFVNGSVFVKVPIWLPKGIQCPVLPSGHVEEVDTKKVFDTLLTDLSQEFVCLPHDLIIAKLNAYGFSLRALN